MELAEQKPVGLSFLNRCIIMRGTAFRILTLLLCLMIFGTFSRAEKPVSQRYSDVIYDTFDTVVTLIGYTSDPKVFSDAFAEVDELFHEYHRLFDAYHTYPGIENLCSINQKAGQSPVRVDQRLFDFLDWCLTLEARFGTDYINIAMGSVLQIWHRYRDDGIADPSSASLPTAESLRSAARHCEINDIILDPEAMTVAFSDPELQLDFGAVAKGYTAQKAAEYLASSDMPSFILNAGGNVCAGMAKADSGDKWGVGIQDPDGGISGNDLFDVIFTTERAVVTSGDYQRYYIVDGQRYAHLISPETLMPADHFRAVTVISEDSALSDFLSTYLFIADYDAGRALIDSMTGVDALWILPDRSVLYTDGMAAYLKSTGATNH